MRLSGTEIFLALIKMINSWKTLFSKHLMLLKQLRLYPQALGKLINLLRNKMKKQHRPIFC